MTLFFSYPLIGNETWLKNSTQVSYYGKFVSNNFVWTTVKIGVIWAKITFGVCVCVRVCEWGLKRWIDQEFIL